MTVKIPLFSVRILGLVALVLGLGYFWGWAVPLHAHMGVGGLMVLGLWALALVAWGKARTLALVALAVGAAVPVVGLGQLHWSVGEVRWPIQAAHVALALGAMGVAEMLARRLKDTAAAPLAANG
ncbi:hypothetical protein [Rhodocista pekingensis]|uniref:Transmembrane protein n=1 Tax=Rhodocista pekingensis TaxID=201185 RepID=A0ABW2KZF6_9PROT